MTGLPSRYYENCVTEMLSNMQQPFTTRKDVDYAFHISPEGGSAPYMEAFDRLIARKIVTPYVTQTGRIAHRVAQ